MKHIIFTLICAILLVQLAGCVKTSDIDASAAENDSTTAVETESTDSDTETMYINDKASSVAEDTTTQVVGEKENGDKLLYAYYISNSPDFYGLMDTDPSSDDSEYTIPTGAVYKFRSNDGKQQTYSGRRMQIIYDRLWLLFDTVTGETSELAIEGIPSDYNYINIVCDTDTNKVNGAVLCSAANNKSAYLSFDKNMQLTNMQLTDFEHTYINAYTNCGLLVAQDYIEGGDGEDAYLSYTSTIYDISTGKAVRTVDGLISIINNGSEVYYKQTPIGELNAYRFTENFYILDASLNRISDDLYDMAGLTEEGNIQLRYARKDSVANDSAVRSCVVLDPKGAELRRGGEGENVCYIWRDYAAVVSDGALRLTKWDGTEVARLCDWYDGMIFHWMISGYFSTSKTIYADDYNIGYEKIVQSEDGIVYEAAGLPKTFPSALYMIVEDTTKIGNNGYEYVFIPDTGEVGRIDLAYVGGYAKPVLYLYPETETTLNVSFEHPERITVSYPDISDGWTVTASPDGTIADKKGRSYYALYWEEDGCAVVDFSTGFIVSADKAASFLEDKLAALGFTEREANEFIMYWLPILVKNGESVVHFELTESRQLQNALYITPVPDSLLRVAIHIKKTDGSEHVTEQTLPRFVRIGFAAIEWGGFDHSR